MLGFSAWGVPASPGLAAQTPQPQMLLSRISQGMGTALSPGLGPQAELGVYSVLARGFAVPQTSLEGGTAQLEGTMP